MMLQLDKLILILVRITAFVVVVPGLSFRGIPNILKIGISLSVASFAYLMTPPFTLEGNMTLFLFLLLREVMLGLALGYICQMVFAVVEMAGNLIDFQAGFSMASVFDPVMGQQASNYGRMYHWIAMGAFFILDMHQVLMGSVSRSFELVPLASVGSIIIGAESVVILFYRMFELGINLAAPIIITMLVTDGVLGIIARTVPQINVFMLGMSMKAMISFFAFMVSASWILKYAGNVMGQIPGYLEGFMGLLGSGG